MVANLPQDYRAWLTPGSSYRFRPCDEPGREVVVIARRSAAGAVWLLYELAGDTPALRYWVMPNGGLSAARDLGSERGPLLLILPSVANVLDLEEAVEQPAAGDPGADLRRQINELLDGIDWGDCS